MASIIFPPGFMDTDFKHYYRTTSCARGRMRCLAMFHLQQGKKMKEVSEIVQQSRVSIHKWLCWLNEESGIEHLVGFVRGRGRHSKLSFVGSQDIISEIERLQADRDGGRVTGKDIQAMIQDNWGVSYTLSSVYTLLKRLNIVWITSRSHHPKADIAAQESFKKTFPKRSSRRYQKI